MSAAEPWATYAHSEQEYAAKQNEKHLKEMQLSPYHDLLTFYLLKKSCDKHLNLSEQQFNSIPNKYTGEQTCSLPPNFAALPQQKRQMNEEQLKADKSLLFSLLGGYNPPPLNQLSINPLTDDDLEHTLKFEHVLAALQPPQSTQGTAMPPQHKQQ
eukprot:CAMPEP_0197023480 /NCGR_PEP_ID=MMETSP1384-20130603/4165_1 /TAXON_ID=29189 /ORGANISM="Ammonia sp." /LENGTH=155 /DNA_ID=CAMNT_0042451695 /DNA_START=23 /DNA_END=490 /DNA_ORIENTATION=+